MLSGAVLDGTLAFGDADVLGVEPASHAAEGLALHLITVLQIAIGLILAVAVTEASARGGEMRLIDVPLIGLQGVAILEVAGGEPELRLGGQVLEIRDERRLARP